MGLFPSCSGCPHPTSAAPPSRLPWGWYTPTSKPRAPPTGPGGCPRCQNSHGAPGGYTTCVPNPASPTGLPDPPAASDPPQAHLGTAVCLETTVAPVCSETTGVLDVSDVPARLPDLAAAPDRPRVPNRSSPLQLHPGTNSTPPNVPNTANPACGCKFGPLPAGAVSSNFTALGHHPHGQSAQISIAHACAQDCRSFMCPTLASSNPPVRALSHQREPPKTEFFQIGPNSNQSHSVPRDTSDITRCPAGRKALELTSVQNSGPRVTPSGSDALSTDGYRKRITFSDVVKRAQTVPVAPNGAQIPCAQLSSAQRTRAQAKTLPKPPVPEKSQKRSNFQNFDPCVPNPTKRLRQWPLLHLNARMRKGR